MDKNLTFWKVLNLILILFLGLGFLGPAYGEVTLPVASEDHGLPQATLPVQEKFDVKKFSLEARRWMDTMAYLPPEKFPTESEVYRKKMEQSIEEGGKFCLIAARSGDESCFQVLKAAHRNFIDKMLLARIRYLDYLHRKRIRVLKVSRLEVLKDLEGREKKGGTPFPLPKPAPPPQ